MSNRALNPAQRRVFDELLSAGSPEIPADPEARDRVLSHCETRTRSSVARWQRATGDRLWIGKSAITEVLQCEGLWSAQRTVPEFVWSLAAVIGVVVHVAIQHQHQDQHLEAAFRYVETAVEVVRETHPAGQWLQEASKAQAIELRSQANSLLGQWNDTWPQLPPEWRVQAEPYHVAELCGGALVLSSRPDLVVGGVPRRTEARQVIVDLKTGTRLPWHAKDDAWFYALVYILRIGVAPARSIVYSIPSGTWNPEPEIDEGKLVAAGNRLGEAVARLADLASGREPRLTPNTQSYCQWCPDKPSCPAYAAAESQSQSGGS